MKEDSKWPLGSYISIIVGAATVLILKLYAAQKGASHFSSGRILPILFSLSPFLFAVLVINIQNNPRALKYLSLAVILQSVAAVAGYCHAIFGEYGLAGSLDLGMVPLYQFGILAVAAAAVLLLEEKKDPRGSRRK